jgi:hypothetical protein
METGIEVLLVDRLKVDIFALVFRRPRTDLGSAKCCRRTLVCFCMRLAEVVVVAEATTKLRTRLQPADLGRIEMEGLLHD